MKGVLGNLVVVVDLVVVWRRWVMVACMCFLLPCVPLLSLVWVRVRLCMQGFVVVSNSLVSPIASLVRNYSR